MSSSSSNSSSSSSMPEDEGAAAPGPEKTTAGGLAEETETETETETAFSAAALQKCFPEAESGQNPSSDDTTTRRSSTPVAALFPTVSDSEAATAPVHANVSDQSPQKADLTDTGDAAVSNAPAHPSTIDTTAAAAAADSVDHDAILAKAVESAATGPHVALADPSKNAVFERIKDFLRAEGLTPFSTSVALEFYRGQLDRAGGAASMARVTAYLLKAAVNGKSLRGAGAQHGCPQCLPGLRAVPVWRGSCCADVGAGTGDETEPGRGPRFAWLDRLEEAYPAMRAEFLALRASPEGAALFQPYRAPSRSEAGSSEDSASQPGAGESDSNPEPAAPSLGKRATDSGNWSVCYLQLHGLDFAANTKLLPVTMAAVEAALGARDYKHTFLSALSPWTVVSPHHGPTNKKLRVHLPLHIPAVSRGRCSLQVDGETIQLQEGKAVLFDDSFLHSASNTGAEPRVVLILVRLVKQKKESLPFSVLLSLERAIVRSARSTHSCSTLLHFSYLNSRPSPYIYIYPLLAFLFVFACPAGCMAP
jgi:aspartate beta-hydroxylase